MARLVITRPNGEVERAELTTDKALAGNDRLSVEKAGTTYYAKLDSGLSTHMYVIKPDGRKLYVQKEVKFVWKYEITGTQDNMKNMVIPRTGKYKLVFHESGERGVEEVDNYYDRVDVFSIGTVFKDWGIEATSGTIYKMRTTNSNGDPGEENFEDTETTLQSIEYIGEA